MEKGREKNSIKNIKKDMKLGWRECVIRMEGVKEKLMNLMN